MRTRKMLDWEPCRRCGKRFIAYDYDDDDWPGFCVGCQMDLEWGWDIKNDRQPPNVNDLVDLWSKHQG